MTEDRKVGRPAKTERAEERPRKRVPVSGQRDILTIADKDPNFYYRWVKDTSANGSRIQKFLMGGYEMVSSDTHQIGEDLVYRTSDGGSVIRIPESGNGHLYLMRQPIEFYNEDFAAKQQGIDDMEKDIFLPSVADGQYGEVRTEQGR